MSIQVSFNRDEENTLRVRFYYWLENQPHRKHTKQISFFQRYRKNKLDPDKIEAFVRFMLLKKAITPELLFYENITHLRMMIFKNLYLIESPPTGRLNRHKEVFREFINLYEQDGLKAFPPPPTVKLREKSPPDEIGVQSIEKIEIPLPPTKNSDDVSIYPKNGLLEIDAKNPNTGRSTLVLGASFSGKTYLLVESLNQLHPTDYELILFFTESKNAEALKNIKEGLPIIIYEGFKPHKVEFLKKINDLLDNRYRFLVVLDDIVDQKMSKTLNKMILTYRNANISTCILIQYPNLISKSSRSSFHQCVITGSRSIEWWESTCKVFDLREWARLEVQAAVDPHKLLKIPNSQIYTYLKKETKKNGRVIYLDLRKGKDPLLYNLT